MNWLLQSFQLNKIEINCCTIALVLEIIHLVLTLCKTKLLTSQEYISLRESKQILIKFYATIS